MLAPPGVVARFVTDRDTCDAMRSPVVVMALDVAKRCGVAVGVVDAKETSGPSRTVFLRTLATMDASSVLRRRALALDVAKLAEGLDARVLVVTEQWTIGGLERAAILSMGTSLGRWREAIALLVGVPSVWSEVHVEDWRAHWLGRSRVSTETGKSMALERLALLRASSGESIYEDRDHNAAEALGMLAWSVAYGIERLVDGSKSKA